MGIDESLFLNAEDLLEQKVNARKKLLQLNPEEAQHQVDQVLYPQYWKALGIPEWEDSLEVNSAKTNP